jgi:hypothetical protein
MIFYDLQCSHICGIGCCINPTHSVIEPSLINTQRRSCHNTTSSSTCLHTPRCLKPTNRVEINKWMEDTVKSKYS